MKYENFYYQPVVGERSISMSPCLSVCLCMYANISQKPHAQTAHQMLCACCLQLRVGSRRCGFLRVNISDGISVGSAVFAQFTVATNTDTDNATCHSCSSMPHLGRSAGDVA